MHEKKKKKKKKKKPCFERVSASSSSGDSMHVTDIIHVVKKTRV